MRKSRNSFFQESSFQAYNPNINMNPNMTPGMNANGAPFETSASNYFYQGPVPNNYTTNSSNTDIESRFAKIERQLNRMEYRLNKLENNANVLTNDDFDTSNSNMYML